MRLINRRAAPISMAKIRKRKMNGANRTRPTANMATPINLKGNMIFQFGFGNIAFIMVDDRG